MRLKRVFVDDSAAAKVRAFFPWVYRDQLVEVADGLEPGELVLVCPRKGRPLGVGYANLRSVISVRILSFDPEVVPDRSFFELKLRSALSLRDGLWSRTNALRLVHAEGDGLPGLVVDYYDGYASVQFNSAGMERLRGLVLDALRGLLPLRGILDRSDERMREKEGLPPSEGPIWGEVPDRIWVREGDLEFLVDLKEGQKTGFYLDQRANREAVASSFDPGTPVLDLFCHTGGFGLSCARRGAKEVVLVDVSRSALEMAGENARRNGLSGVSLVQADAFDFLRGERKRGAAYGTVVLDPPPFAKSRRELEGALRGYRDLVLQSARLLAPGGKMAIFSCSHWVGEEDLLGAIASGLADAEREGLVLLHLRQDQDHPVRVGAPMSYYLKGFLLSLL